VRYADLAVVIAAASTCSIRGHVNSNVTGAVYRHQIADTVTRAPAAMDRALAGRSTA
jgi:hypothetical protein